MIEVIRKFYDPKRLTKVDPDFLAFEEQNANKEDLERIHQLRTGPPQKLPNDHNSILLYITRLSDEFNFKQARCDTIGGSPPDIDVDYTAAGRDKLIQHLVDEWGRDCVANIVTFGTLKPKSLTRRYFKTIGEEKSPVMYEILDKIPEPQSGFEATLEEIIKGNEEKSYPAHPELATETKYQGWYEFASKLEDMVAHFGIHAAGLVISNDPIYKTIPMWKNSKAERITQLDMKEVEELGKVKFDFLVITNLDILQDCCALIKANRNINIDIDNLSDGDPRAYKLMQHGLLTGIFQMETSKSAKELIQKIQPTSIEELSAISAINRPGPLAAGLGDIYIENKNNGYPSEDLPQDLHPILKDTYWALIYQEQVMDIAAKLCGDTLREADTIRRIIGKKKPKAMAKLEPEFKRKMLLNSSMTDIQINSFWNDLVGFSRYAFNKSHSISYSIITYQCAYLKAHYPQEFFCALMSQRGKTMQPKLWAEKAPEYIQEARQLGIKILAPSIQKSGIGFTIHQKNIYFGLEAIRGVGKTAAKSIIAARRAGPFIDIYNFIERINTRKVTTKTFESLIYAGAFDHMGYSRQTLLENAQRLYQYPKERLAYIERISEAKQRTQNNTQKDKLKQQWANELKEAKKAKKTNTLTTHQEWLLTRDNILKEIRTTVRNIKDLPEEEQLNKLKRTYTNRDIEAYQLNLAMRKKPELKIKEEPIQPPVTRTKSIQLSVQDIIEQAEYIGCYVHTHPVRILYPDATHVAALVEGEYSHVAGHVTKYKQITTRKGNKEMCFIEMTDGTGLVELIVFPAIFARIIQKPKTGDIIYIQGKVETTEPQTKMIAFKLQIYNDSSD
jgi:DNA-directed DNA polymerase III PolC